jgi:hypothetical protein
MKSLQQSLVVRCSSLSSLATNHESAAEFGGMVLFPRQNFALEDAIGSHTYLLASIQHACDAIACLSGVHL